MSDEPSKSHEPTDREETYVVPLDANELMETVFDRFMAHYTPFGFHARSEDVTYRPLPYEPEEDDELLIKEPWRLMLEFYVEDRRMLMGIDLYGDVILGRGHSRPGRIIIDLEACEAQKLGVSREHTMLRPTPTNLFVIDQGSTNGTTVDGVRSGVGVAMALKDEVLLGLGNMILMVHIQGMPKTASKEKK
jgi:hypothetical protein